MPHSEKAHKASQETDRFQAILFRFLWRFGASFQDGPELPKETPKRRDIAFAKGRVRLGNQPTSQVQSGLLPFEAGPGDRSPCQALERIGGGPPTASRSPRAAATAATVTVPSADTLQKGW